MRRLRPAFLVVALSAVLLTTGCAAPPPYIHREGEFNRELPTFAKEPLNIDSVIICYNKYGTKPEIVANMASAECARFNKKAEFLRQSLDQCPLSTPMAAVYACVRGN
jgi:hypothetical protein